MNIEFNSFALEISLAAQQHGQWLNLPLKENATGYGFDFKGVSGELRIARAQKHVDYAIQFKSQSRTRLRIRCALLNERNLFHLIPGNIHGDNNAAHVRPGEFPCLTKSKPFERNCAPLWEFRADRASHPVSILCCDKGAVGIAIDPYSPCEEADEKFIRNGVFAGLPNVFGVSVGYGNDPLTFVEKTSFEPSTYEAIHSASASGKIYAFAGDGRFEAHKIIRAIYEPLRELPTHKKTPKEGLRALADAFAQVNYSPDLQQYTNRKCQVPVNTELKPWRAVVEIGWTAGSMLAYPFDLAERIFPDLKLPKTSGQIYDEICEGFNDKSGLINDTAINQFTKNLPDGWNKSTINGWWSGFLPQTKDAHCAYTNAHAAYYMLCTSFRAGENTPQHRKWIDVSLKVLNTVVSLQRQDGAYGYIFSSAERKVIDWDGFAGCWFAAALIYAWKITGDTKFLESAERSMVYYRQAVRNLACWGSPMDTFKSIDSEGNLAFIRAAKLLYEFTGNDIYLEMLTEGANYEYLWRYGFRTRPECRPLKGSHWNSCGGSITSVSNPHIHPMSVVVTEDLKYLAEKSGDEYHSRRADDAIAWLLNTMELYPEVTGYGRYGVLSERTCPSDGLLAERFYDDGSPSSTWWSYNAWAAGSAMEALAERVLATELPEKAKRLA